MPNKEHDGKIYLGIRKPRDIEKVEDCLATLFDYDECKISYESGKRYGYWANLYHADDSDDECETCLGRGFYYPKGSEKKSCPDCTDTEVDDFEEPRVEDEEWCKLYRQFVQQPIGGFPDNPIMPEDLGLPTDRPHEYVLLDRIKDLENELAEKEERIEEAREYLSDKCRMNFNEVTRALEILEDEGSEG